MTRLRLGQIHTAGLLLLLTGAAFLIHGYHPYAEDAEIYLPGVERLLNPALFPVGQEFFQSHASMTLFPNLLAFFFRVTHLPFEWGLLAWQATSIFLLLLGCWQLSGILFPTARARWASVCMIAALLTIPVAATALYLMDPYLNPRNLAAFAAVFAVTRMLEKKYLVSFLWIAFAACVHPLMWVFPFSFCALWFVLERLQLRPAIAREPEMAAVAGGFVAAIPFVPVPSSAYHEAALRHAYFYLQAWRWYEWLGIIGPLILLWYFGRISHRQGRPVASRACRAFLIYGIIYFFISLVLDLPPQFEALARVQPMRSLHLLYLFLFVCIGGLSGEFLLKDRAWRWLALLVPLSLGMFIAQRSLYTASEHIAWPGSNPKNQWEQAFLWIRGNTPANAMFAVDPDYMDAVGEDATGFRCLAQRSRMADFPKDGGAASMFPPLAPEWWGQVQAVTPWKKLKASDFLRLKEKYGVTWVVLQQPGIAGLDCAYQNTAVRVCRVQ